MDALLKKIAVTIEKRQSNDFTYPVDKQKAYIAHFKEPKDGIERGYFQYCCQMKLYRKLLYILLNLAAFPLSVYHLATYKKTCTAETTSVDAVFLHEGLPLNIVPDSLRERYPNMPAVPTTEKCLRREDRAFLRSVFLRYPFSWMLWLKLTIKVSQYSHVITKYSPKAVISCNEFSYTAPFLTEYCHMRGVKSINVMHGEKYYYMRDSFARYDEFFVWSQAYVDLFVSMRADKEQFVVEVPRSLRIENDGSIEKKYDYTYYLAAATDEELGTIAGKLKKLNDCGKRISVRPHPRYSDISKIRAHFPFANIEDLKAVTIEESLLQTDAAVAICSTVLYQAYCNGITAVIDDISSPAQFAKLQELQYAMLSLEHCLLSGLMEEV